MSVLWLLLGAFLGAGFMRALIISQMARHLRRGAQWCTFRGHSWRPWTAAGHIWTTRRCVDCGRQEHGIFNDIAGCRPEGSKR